MANLSQEELRRLARLGAVSRLQELRREEDAIRAEFPELFGGSRGRGRRAGAQTTAPERAARGGARRKRAMSAAQRKAVSERMRKYWAERRKSKGGK